MSKSVAHPALSSNLHVVGIDSALLRIGLGRHYERTLHGCFFDTDTKGGERLVQIYNSISSWLRARRPRPTLAVIEGYSYDSEGKVFQLGEAGGVIRLALTQFRLPYLEVPPASLKLFVAGDGEASKKHMMDAVAEFYGIETDDDNVADAIGLTMWGVVKLTGKSYRRCELQAIKNLSIPKRRRRAIRPGKETTM